MSVYFSVIITNELRRCEASKLSIMQLLFRLHSLPKYCSLFYGFLAQENLQPHNSLSSALSFFRIRAISRIFNFLWLPRIIYTRRITHKRISSSTKSHHDKFQCGQKTFNFPFLVNLLFPQPDRRSFP